MSDSTEAATNVEPKPVTVVALAVVTIDNDIVFTPSTAFDTTANPYQVAETLIRSVTGDVTKGWAGKNPDEWGSRAKPYAEVAGKGSVVLHVAIGDLNKGGQAKKAAVKFSTTESVARAVVSATHVAADELEGWAMGLKRKAAGFNW